MPDLTTNYELKKPLQSENYNVQVQNDNMDAIDAALTPTAEPTTANVDTNGPFKLVKWVSLFTKLIKAITGKDNWFTAPSKSLEDFNEYMADYIRNPGYAADSGAADAYVVTLNPIATAYAAGMGVRFKAANANTGACTINVNGLGAKPIKMDNGTDPPAGMIAAGAVVTVVYDGTNFQVVTTGLAAHLADEANAHNPEAVIAPTLLNSWVNHGAVNTAGYWKDTMKIVHLKGTIKDGTIGNAAFQLPAGYRPANTLLFAIQSNSAFGRVTIDSGGNVTVDTGLNASASLDGITFRAGV